MGPFKEVSKGSGIALFNAIIVIIIIVIVNTWDSLERCQMEVDSWNCHHQRNHCHQHRHHRHYRNHYHCHLCHHHRHRQYLGLFREVSNGSGQLECHSCPIVSTLPRAESSFHHCCWSVVQIHKYTNTQNHQYTNSQIRKYRTTQLLLKMPRSWITFSPLLLVECSTPKIPSTPPQPQPPFLPADKLKIIDGDIWKFSCQGGLPWRKSLFAHHCLTSEAADIHIKRKSTYK